MTDPTPQTTDRRLAVSPEVLAETLIAAVWREVSEGPAKAYLAGYQAACSDPCSLCALAGGTGCESPTCRRPA